MRWGLGPVFTYEWLMLSRRWQLYALRALAVAGPGVGLFVVWWVKLAGQPLTIRGLAATGQTFFYALAGTQLALVLLAAPAYTAGSICLDRARGTLVHLLATDLSDAELVLGKLAARLLPVLALAACPVPVLFGATLLGGINPRAAVGAILVTLGVAVLGCTLALTLSVWGRKTHEVLLAAYAAVGLPILIQPMWSVLARHGWLPPSPDWLEHTDPFRLAFLPYLHPGTRGLAAQAGYLGVALGLSAALILLAVARVRAVVLRQEGRPARAGGWRLARLLECEARWLPSPSLDRNPVLWREWNQRRPWRWGRLIWVAYALLAGFFSLMAMGTHSPSVSAWVNSLQVSVGLLFLSVGSVMSLAEERARGSLDLLLTTPLSDWEILWGKWWWTYRMAPRLALLAALVGAPAAVHAGGEAVFLLVGLVLAYGAAVTSLGLALATWIRGLGRALAVSVTLMVLATVGPLLPVLVGVSPRWAEGLAEASPFFGVGQLTFMLGILQPRGRYWDCLIWDGVWAAVYLITAGALFLLTRATFDRCVGRMGPGLTRTPPVTGCKHAG